MGSGIAAHLANVGMDVTLLDLTDQSVRTAFDKAKQARPPHFYIPETANAIRLGSIENNMAWVSEADWICEAIIEKFDAKRPLFRQIEILTKPGAIVTTNTSGLEIGRLAEGRSAEFRRTFMGTHFFNPPRYLKLLELIPTSTTVPEVVEATTRFLEDHVARRVVVAKDTPGFIANRFGMWSMFNAVHVAEKLGLSVEETDAITGPFIGRPNSASFRLNDLVGIDIMQDIARNLIERCPHDPYIKQLAKPRSISFLMEKGWIGEKSGQGYFRREGKEFFSLDLKTDAYRMKRDADFASIRRLQKLPLGERISTALELRDPVGEFLREYLIPTLQYAAYLKEEISHSVEDFDRVMKWGFGWEAGPFELLEMIGAAKSGVSSRPFYHQGAVLGFNGSYVNAKCEPQYAVLTDFPVVSEQELFRVRDMGDGVHAVCVTNKMGVYTPVLIHSLTSYLESGKSNRIVLTSEARVFSAGFDLKFISDAVSREDWELIDSELKAFQYLGLTLRLIPSCAAIFGTCLGGGLEMAMSCSVIAASPETQIGLPESRVGVIPSGGGIAMMHTMHQGSAKALVEAAKSLVLGTITRSADEARKKGLVRETDVTVYHPDRLLTEAKRLALSASVVTLPAWAAVEGPVIGMIERFQEELFKSGELTEHDKTIGDKIKQAIAKAVSFEDALDKERAGFVDLLKDGLTQNRIKHMIDNGKPLRN